MIGEPVPDAVSSAAVDRGAFVGAGERLRAAGVPVTFTAFAALTEALRSPRRGTYATCTGWPA